MKLVALFAAACAPAMTPPAATVPVAAGVNVPAPAHGPGTIVVTLTQRAPTKIVDGPFTITSINPGSRLALAIGSDACAADLVWFDYSGGGVAIGSGQTLCAESFARGAITHGFSGHGE